MKKKKKEKYIQKNLSINKTKNKIDLARIRIYDQIDTQYICIYPQRGEYCGINKTDKNKRLKQKKNFKKKKKSIVHV